MWRPDTNVFEEWLCFSVKTENAFKGREDNVLVEILLLSDYSKVTKIASARREEAQ